MVPRMFECTEKSTPVIFEVIGFALRILKQRMEGPQLLEKVSGVMQYVRIRLASWFSDVLEADH